MRSLLKLDILEFCILVESSIRSSSSSLTVTLAFGGLRPIVPLNLQQREFIADDIVITHPRGVS